MASKPSSLPQWATDASRTVEPSAGEKGTGWQGDNKPPARKMNWLFNILYTWIQYVSDGVFVADASSGDEGIDATGDGAAAGVKGTGGATNGAGVEGQGTGSGAGVTGTGGATNATGVAGTGTGTGAGVTGTGGSSSGAGFVGQGGAPNGNAFTGTGDGTGAGFDGTGGDSSGPGVKGTGGASNGVGGEFAGTGTGAGITATGGSSNGAGVDGTGQGTGAGVKGTGVNGPGVHAIGDTTSPAAPSLLVGAQDAVPSTITTEGGLAVVKTALRMADGSAYRKVPVLRGAQVATDEITATTADFSTQVTLPANMLKAGDVIKVRATLRSKVGTGSGSPTSLSMTVCGFVYGNAPTGINTGDVWHLDCAVTIWTAGGPGTGSYRTIEIFDPASGTTTVAVQSSITATPDTTASNVIKITATVPSGDTLELRELHVEA